MQNPFNPRAGVTPAIDALIGNAYEVVKYVAYYIKEIQYVAFNMEHIYNISQNMYQNVLKTVEITALDAVYEITLPEGVTPALFLNTSVTVITPDGAAYGASADNFSWVVDAGKLTVTIPAGAPAAFVGSEIRWLINWQSPVVVS